MSVSSSAQVDKQMRNSARAQELQYGLTLWRAREYNIASLERCATRKVLDDGRDVEDHRFCPRFLKAVAI